jgi:hypothetical protein
MNLIFAEKCLPTRFLETALHVTIRNEICLRPLLEFHEVNSHRKSTNHIIHETEIEFKLLIFSETAYRKTLHTKRENLVYLPTLLTK